MDLTQIIIICLAVLVSFLVFMFLRKLIFKVLILVVITIVSYIGWNYYSGGDIISDINSLYCEVDEVDEIKCKCFVGPIMKDLNNRFSIEEIIEIKGNPIKSWEEFLNSYNNSEKDINRCFKDNGESDNILEDIWKDIQERFGFIF